MGEDIMLRGPLIGLVQCALIIYNNLFMLVHTD